jgi:RNA polymerase subunit RPABC4/transcription elongation factor Spt4
MEQFILNLLKSVGNIDFGFVWQIFLYSLIIFWLVVLYWIWLDSGDRTSNTTVRCLYVLLAASLNVIGLIIYLIIRPSQTIEEIYWADLERRYLKYETSSLGDCPQCGAQLYPGYNFCPNCKYKLKRRCSRCEVLVDRKNKYCPNCGQEMKKRVSPEEASPTKEVMEQQIQASKDEATEVVETKKTRYSIQSGFSVKIGEAIVSGYEIIINKSKELFNKAKDFFKPKKEQAQNEPQQNKKQKKNKSK